MSLSLIRAISARKNHFSLGFYNRYKFHLQDPIIAPNCCNFSSLGFTSRANRNLIPNLNLSCLLRLTNGFCSVSIVDNEDISCERFNVELEDKKPKVVYKKPIDFTKIDVNLLPTVMIIGRPNVGKSTLYNRWCSRLSTSSVYLACFARPRNGFASVSFSRKVESNGCNGDASGEKLVGSTLLLLGPGRGNSSNTLLLGPGRSTKATGADEKWDELLTRASSRRLEIKLKKKCDNNYYFSEKLISFMNWLQWLKCKLMHIFTGEEETPKSYDTASASRALARLLGPLIIAAFLYCAKEIVSKLWDIHKQKKIQLALEDRFNEHEQKVLETAAVRSDDKLKEIREDYEELRERLNEDVDGLWKAVILLSRGKK